jgi:hypothetical protein
MRAGDNKISLELSDGDGSLAALHVEGRLLSAPRKAPLFRLGLRSPAGDLVELGPDAAASFSVKSPSPETWELSFDRMGSLDFDFQVQVRFDKGASQFAFTWSLANRSDHGVEFIQLPSVLVPDTLGFAAREPKIFWPGYEGCLISDPGMREKCGGAYLPVSYPAHTRGGYYPGTAQMQFMAYLVGSGGLYFACHDPSFTTKEIDFRRVQGGIELIMKVFPGPLGPGEHRAAFPVILAPCGPQWTSPAEIYRTWVQSGSVSLPPALAENDSIPAWVKESPVVVTYPVRGNGHHSFRTYPNEYFPYIKALPHLDRLSDAWNAPLLALLMHWEGTAPWAPPYVWPPMGGEEKLKEFIEALHGRGHRLGLYCSGTAWTNIAGTGDGRYTRQEQFDREGLASEMCVGPKGELDGYICNADEIRWGYDMCTHSTFARRVVAEEAAHMAAAGVDYIQLFDQNLGGASYGCWSKTHGHGPGPGPWQPESMKALIRGVQQAMARTGNVPTLGCEAAAAEAYLGELPLNDLRFMVNWYGFGTPVPAFAYVYHEYVNNFCGNQWGALDLFDPAVNPANHFLRTAYSFVAGDLLTAVLKSGGEIHWGWCARWDEVPPPEQKPFIDFIGRLNAWRRGAGGDFLIYGRMQNPASISGTRDVPLKHRFFPVVFPVPSVLTSAWSSPCGRKAQFLCNWLPEAQQVRLHLPEGTRNQEFRSSLGNPLYPKLAGAEGVVIDLEPLSTVMIESIGPSKRPTGERRIAGV